MASTYKIAIGACVLERVGQGEFTLVSQIAVEPRLRSTSSILSDSFPHHGLAVSVQNLLELMLTSSDNTATDVLLDAIGGPAAVRRCIGHAGLADLRVDRTTAQILRQFAGLPDPPDPATSFFDQFQSLPAPSRELPYLEDGRGPHYLAFERDPRDQATPQAMTRFLEKIWRDDWPTRQGAAMLRGILARSKEPVRIGRGLPAGMPLAHKTGTLAATVNDAGVFDLPDGGGQVAIVVFVKGAMVPWETVERGIGDIARAVYDDYARASVTPPWQVACPYNAGALGARLECGRLDVPERSDRPGGARITLPFVIIHSTAAQPQPDPVVFLHGGPGAAPLESLQTIARFADHPFARERDIILYNQRGSRMTQPALECAAPEDARAQAFVDDISYAQRDARIADLALECLGQLRAQGRDVEAYDARANAHDLRALRNALGIRQWNLLAVSYGTWMAQAAARADPEGVRSLILDSVMSPRSDLFMSEGPRNFSRALDRVLTACAADGACATAFPDLGVRLRHVLVALDAAPLRMQVAGEGGAPLDVTVNWHDFLGVVHWMLYNARTLRLVPLLIDTVSRGDRRLLTSMIENVYPGFAHGAPGPGAAFFTIVCNDQYTARNPLPIARADVAWRGFSIVSFMGTVCQHSLHDAAAKRAPQAVRMRVPTLLLSGRFDPMTPDLYAIELAHSLARVWRVTIPASGHSTLSEFESCQTQIAQQFLDRLARGPMPECAAHLLGPAFFTRMADVVKSPPSR